MHGPRRHLWRRFFCQARAGCRICSLLCGIPVWVQASAAGRREWSPCGAQNRSRKKWTTVQIRALSTPFRAKTSRIELRDGPWTTRIIDILQGAPPRHTQSIQSYSPDAPKGEKSRLGGHTYTRTQLSLLSISVPGCRSASSAAQSTLVAETWGSTPGQLRSIPGQLRPMLVNFEPPAWWFFRAPQSAGPFSRGAPVSLRVGSVGPISGHSWSSSGHSWLISGLPLCADICSKFGPNLAENSEQFWSSTWPRSAHTGDGIRPGACRFRANLADIGPELAPNLVASLARLRPTLAKFRPSFGADTGPDSGRFERSRPGLS